MGNTVDDPLKKQPVESLPQPKKRQTSVNQPAPNVEEQSPRHMTLFGMILRLQVLLSTS